jgi:hypothetical protein
MFVQIKRGKEPARKVELLIAALESHCRGMPADVKAAAKKVCAAAKTPRASCESCESSPKFGDHEEEGKGESEEKKE